LFHFASEARNPVSISAVRLQQPPTGTALAPGKCPDPHAPAFPRITLPSLPIDVRVVVQFDMRFDHAAHLAMGSRERTVHLLMLAAREAAVD
jgi:hypothetical protein